MTQTLSYHNEISKILFSSRLHLHGAEKDHQKTMKMLRRKSFLIRSCEIYNTYETSKKGYSNFKNQNKSYKDLQFISSKLLNG